MLPMSLFQEAASSLDGVSTAATILAISCFLRITQERDKTPLGLLVLFAVSVTLVTSCRQHALPLLGLIFLSAAYTRRRATLVTGTLSSLFTVLWTVISLKTTVFRLPPPRPRRPKEHSTTSCTPGHFSKSSSIPCRCPRCGWIT